MDRVWQRSPAAITIVGAVASALIALAVGAAIAHEGPGLTAAALLLIPAAVFVAVRPVNALLAAVAISLVVPYWYGKGGINVSHLTAGLAVLWIVTAGMQRHDKVRLRSVDVAVIALLLAAVLDWWLRNGTLLAARVSGDTMLPLVFYFAGRLAAGRSTRTVLFILIGGATVASLTVFYEFSRGAPVFQDPYSYYWSAGAGAIFRPGGVFGSPPPAVTILAMVSLVAIALLAETAGRRRTLLKGCIVLMVAAGVLTFTRAGWIGFAVGLLTYLVVVRWRGGLRLPRWLAIVPVLAVAFVVALPALSQTSWFQLGVARGGTLAVRESYWTLAGKLIVDSPEHLLVGRGLNSLVAGARPGLGGLSASFAQNPDLITAGAHNQYIRTLLEQGVVGLALMLLWLGGTLAVLVRRTATLPRADRRLAAGLAGAIVSFLVASLADTTLRDTVSFSIVALLTGIAVTVASRPRVEQR